MVRISQAARHNVRRTLETHNVDVVLKDSELDNIIHHLRNELNRAPTGSKSEEANALVSGLLPWRKALNTGIGPEFDHDSWSRLLWDCYTSACNDTQAASRCSNIVESEEAWSDMVVLLLSQSVDEESRSPQAREVTRWMFAGMLVLGTLLGDCIPLVAVWLYNFAWRSDHEDEMTISGRTKVWLLFFNLLIFFVALLWLRFGWTCMRKVRQPVTRKLPRFVPSSEVDAVSSASGKIREERDRLLEELARLRSGATGPGLVPLPATSEPPPLMQALEQLGGNGTRSAEPSASSGGTMLATRVVELGDVVQVSTAFLPAGPRRGLTGVASLTYGGRSADVVFEKEEPLRMVPLSECS